MEAMTLLQSHMYDMCTDIHTTRLQSVLDVAAALQKSQNLTLTSMGRNLSGSIDVKHKIKKVDRLEGNKKLHTELDHLYEGLSSYVFKYLSFETNTPILIDLCYLKDNREIQMLSAEVALKGRSLPLYRDVFKSGELKRRATSFIDKISNFFPPNTNVLIVLDAGFGEDWFKAIEAKNWYWLSRIRQGKAIKCNEKDDWMSIRELMPLIGERAKTFNKAFIMKNHNRSCRVVTKKNALKNTKGKYANQPRNYKAGNGDYSRSAKEPWILATNLPLEFNATKIINYYKKRMQIEESFRDLKSHQFGLGARYARTECIYRWGVKMLLASIVQIVCWIVGIVGHSQGFQRKFQANTVRDKKVFSYFYLGQLIIEHNMLERLNINYVNLQDVIDEELARDW